MNDTNKEKVDPAYDRPMGQRGNSISTQKSKSEVVVTLTEEIQQNKVENTTSLDLQKKGCIKKINQAIEKGVRPKLPPKLEGEIHILGLSRAVSSIKNTLNNKHRIKDITENYIECGFSKQYIEANRANNPQLSINTTFKIMRNTKDDLYDGSDRGGIKY